MRSQRKFFWRKGFFFGRKDFFLFPNACWRSRTRAKRGFFSFYKKNRGFGGRDRDRKTIQKTFGLGARRPRRSGSFDSGNQGLTTLVKKFLLGRSYLWIDGRDGIPSLRVLNRGFLVRRPSLGETHLVPRRRSARLGNGIELGIGGQRIRSRDNKVTLITPNWVWGRSKRTGWKSGTGYSQGVESWLSKKPFPQIHFSSGLVDLGAERQVAFGYNHPAERQSEKVNVYW